MTSAVSCYSPLNIEHAIAIGGPIILANGVYRMLTSNNVEQEKILRKLIKTTPANTQAMKAVFHEANKTKSFFAHFDAMLGAGLTFLAYQCGAYSPQNVSNFYTNLSNLCPVSGQILVSTGLVTGGTYLLSRGLGKLRLFCHLPSETAKTKLGSEMKASAIAHLITGSATIAAGIGTTLYRQ